MPTGPFLTVDDVFLDMHEGADVDWVGATSVAAVLALSTWTPNRAGPMTYDDVDDHECADADYDPQAVTSRTISLASTRIRYDHAQVVFGAEVTITAKYLVYVLGNPASLGPTDRVIGYLDLVPAGGNAESVNAEFSYDPHASGLMEILRSAAPA